MFGLLSGAGGFGAILALVGVPHLRRSVGPDTIVAGAMFIQAGVFIALARTDSLTVAFVVLVAAGAAGLAVVSTVMTVLQLVLPAWIRGRGVAIYLLTMQGSLAVGALVWGAVAEQSSLDTAFTTAGAFMATSALLTLPLRLGRYMDMDMDMARLIDDPPAVTSIHDDDGPILLTVSWEIDPAMRDEFVAAMHPVRKALKRQGALRFHLVEDVERPGHMVESFTMATWSEYRRLPQRATMADKAIHQALVDVAGPELPGFTAHREIRLDSRRGRPNDNAP
jgi:quinol monooxygenase YgiN